MPARLIVATPHNGRKETMSPICLLVIPLEVFLSQNASLPGLAPDVCGRPGEERQRRAQACRLGFTCITYVAPQEMAAIIADFPLCWFDGMLMGVNSIPRLECTEYIHPTSIASAPLN